MTTTATPILLTGASEPEAAVLVPPQATAVPNATAASEPTQRDRHFQGIAEKGRIGWQKISGYNKRSRVEAAIGRYKQVIGDGLRSGNDTRRTTEVGVAVHILNRVLELGLRPRRMNADGVRDFTTHPRFMQQRRRRGSCVARLA
jgi:hypothetical protein